MQAKRTYRKFVPVSIARAADERFSLMTDTTRTEGFTGTTASPAASALGARSSRSALNALSADSAADAANGIVAARTATTMGRFADGNHVLGVRKH